MSTTGFVGPIFELVDSILRGEAGYSEFRTGLRSQGEFTAFIEDARDRLVAGGLPPNDVHFAKRFPASADTLVRSVFSDFAPWGLALPQDYVQTAEQIASSIARGFDHHGLGTYIYPEEGRILLGAVLAFRPQRVIFLGSFYGYWAAWALPALAASGAHAVLVDPDPQVCAVARTNLRRLSPEASFEVVCGTGEEYLACTPTQLYDMVVIDAELPRSHPDITKRGKAIYAHLLRAVLPHLAPSSLLVCHNILFNDHSGCSFFDEVIARNHDELDAFMNLVRSEYSSFIELPTTEGVGVGVRR